MRIGGAYFWFEFYKAKNSTISVMLNLSPEVNFTEKILYFGQNHGRFYLIFFIMLFIIISFILESYLFLDIYWFSLKHIPKTFFLEVSERKGK